MNLTLEERTESMAELQQTDYGIQPLHKYLDLLQTSLDRYEYLRKSGTPDIVLYMEKGLIDRQIVFLSRACGQLIK